MLAAHSDPVGSYALYSFFEKYETSSSEMLVIIFL